MPLHGSLDAERQDDAIRATATRRVILATNIAETSLTVPGVSVVIDTGQVKVARYDPQRGVDSLTLERVTQDSADQRAGRAARRGPGIARRLWESRDRLRAHREPEIARVDLAAPLLDLLAWGGDPASFDWFDPPPPDRVDAALRLLERLGAIERGASPPRVTPLGRQLQRIPLHPRLARILLDGRGAPEIAAACALLAEPLSLERSDSVSTTCDLLPALDRFDRQPFHVRQVAQELRRIAGGALDGNVAARAPEEALRHALFTGYADRLAKRRAETIDRAHAGDRSRRRARPRIGRAGRRLSRGARRRRLDTGWHRRVTDSGREPCRAASGFRRRPSRSSIAWIQEAGACVRGASPAMARSFSAKRP